MNKEEALRIAENILTSRRLNAEETARKRKEEIAALYPEIERITEEIESAKSKCYSVIIEGQRLRQQGLEYNTTEEIEKIAKENLQAQRTREKLLEAFGYPKDYLNVKHTCSKCKDTGLVEGIRCECFKKLIARELSKAYMEECSYKLHDFDEFDLSLYPQAEREYMSKVLAICKRFAAINFSDTSENEKMPSLFLIGNTGLGKTFISSMVAKKVIEDGHSCVFDSLSTIIRKLEDEKFGRSADNTMRLLAETDLVILDDLGAEPHTTLTESFLLDILNLRDNKRLPMMISTNFNEGELKDLYNQRIISRLFGNNFVLSFRGDDIRLLKKNL